MRYAGNITKLSVDFDKPRASKKRGSNCLLLELFNPLRHVNYLIRKVNQRKRSYRYGLFTRNDKDADTDIQTDKFNIVSIAIN